MLGLQQGAPKGTTYWMLVVILPAPPGQLLVRATESPSMSAPAGAVPAPRLLPSHAAAEARALLSRPVGSARTLCTNAGECRCPTPYVAGASPC
jgi:hypothetical protein